MKILTSTIRLIREPVRKSFTDLSIDRISRRFAGTLAALTRAARSDDQRDVEQLGRDQYANSGKARHPARRSGGDQVHPGIDPSAGVSLAGYCTGCHRDASGTGTRELH